jgi:hypothetical protein
MDADVVISRLHRGAISALSYSRRVGGHCRDLSSRGDRDKSGWCERCSDHGLILCQTLAWSRSSEVRLTGKGLRPLSNGGCGRQMGVTSGMVRSIKSGNTRMIKLIISACFSALLFAVPASAYSPPDQPAVSAVSKQPEGKILLVARHGRREFRCR